MSFQVFLERLRAYLLQTEVLMSGLNPDLPMEVRVEWDREDLVGRLLVAAVPHDVWSLLGTGCR